MIDIEFITVNKPDSKRAAELLGPILYNMLEEIRLGEKAQASCSKLKHADELNSGDSVA